MQAIFDISVVAPLLGEGNVTYVKPRVRTGPFLEQGYNKAKLSPLVMRVATENIVPLQMCRLQTLGSHVN